MGQKINPIALRIAKKQTWLTISHYKDNINKFDESIRYLVNGIYLAFNYFTSEIIIKHTPYSIKLIFLVKRNSKSSNNLVYVAQLAKNILQKQYGKEVILIVRETQSSTTNAKIFADILANSISNQPTRYKSIIKNLLK